MSTKLKVLLTTNIPAPYFVDYANELGKYVDLTVLFELKNASDRSNNWTSSLKGKNFKYKFLNALRTSPESGLSFKIKKFLKDRSYDRIIIANPTTLTGVVGLLYCRRHKIPFIIQSEGGFQGSGRGLKEHFKKRLMEKAEMYLTGMGGDNDYFLRYGATKEKLKPYKFASQFQKQMQNSILSESEKASFKKMVGIQNKKTILFVGRFLESKGIDVLLKSYIDLDDDYQLVLVGGQLDKKCEKIIRDNNLRNIYVIDFLSNDQLKNYYKAADIFVFMTKSDTWGLVINEAMSYGLPIITTNKCIAGLCLIENGKNGYLVDCEDYLQAKELINKVLIDDKLKQRIGQSNLLKIQSYTIENMGKVIYDYLTEISPK